MILGTRHTGLVVRELERSLAFYIAIGLRVWRRDVEIGSFISTLVGIQDVRLEWVKLQASDGSLVELLQYHSHPDTQPFTEVPSNRRGCSHIAFTVADIDQTCKEIARLGGSVINQPALAPSGLVKVAYCHDPDGILMELVEESDSHG